MAPSTLLVLIFTYLQVNFNAHGLTLPLQTVTTKCESITKRPQKINQARKVSDKLPCDNLTSNLTCSSQLLVDSCIRTSTNPTGSFSVLNYQEGLYQLPILPNDPPFATNISPCLNVINSLSESANKPTILNSMSHGINPSAAVSNTVISYRSTNLKPPECVNSCSKTKIQVPVPPYNNIQSQANPLNTAQTGALNLPVEIPKYISTKSLPTYLYSLDQIESAPNIPKFCELVPVTLAPNSNIAHEPSCFSSNIFRNISPSQPPFGFKNSLIPLDFNSAVSLQPSSCIFDSINTINNQNIYINSLESLVSQQRDITSNQTNLAPKSMPCSLNSNIPLFCNYPSQTPLSPDLPLTETPLTAPNISPNVQKCPLPIGVISSPNVFKKQDIVTNEKSETCYMPPLSVNQMSPMSKYFKNVRVTTAKLKEFISSFSSKLASKNIPQLKSFTSPSQLPSVQFDHVPLEKALEPSLLVPCSRSLSPSPEFQQNSILFKEPVTCTSRIPTITQAQSCVDSAPPAPQLLPLTFKAPIVPNTITSSFNFPICSTPALFNNFKDNLPSLPSCIYLPNPLTNLLTRTPFNLLKNFESCGNLPDGSFIPPPCPPSPSITSSKSKLLPSVINKQTLNTSLVSTNINSYKDVSNIPLPDLLSSILTKTQCLYDSPHVDPFSPSFPVSMNTISDCDHNSCVAASVMDECILDSLASSLSSSPIASFLNLEPTLDETQLDLCCKNLENMIAILESSMNFNGEVDCNFDSLNM